MHKWIKYIHNFNLSGDVICEKCGLRAYIQDATGEYIIFNLINGFKPNIEIVYKNEDITCDEFIIKNIIE